MTLTRQEFPSSDPRLDWVSVHDPRSRDYAISDVISSQGYTAKQWWHGPILDQGQEGACVGFGWTQEAISSPCPDRSATADRGNAYAIDAYREFQRNDEYPGENYSGTSVLAGAKVMQARGTFGSYRWAFSVDEIRDRLVAPASEGGGPVVIGIPWYDSMYEAHPSGLVEVNGSLVGGHCLLLNEFNPDKRFRGESTGETYRVYGFCNSWGPSYGYKGRGFLREDDLAALLANSGEACAPVDRKRFRLP